MGADQTAAIRPALRELLQAVASNEPDARSLCATFTVPDHPDAWVQALHGTINAAFPRSDEPLSFVLLAGLPALPDLAVESWRAGQYVTFTHGACAVDAVAEFIDRILVALHTTLDADEYEIDIAFEHVD